MNGRRRGGPSEIHRHVQTWRCPTFLALSSAPRSTSAAVRSRSRWLRSLRRFLALRAPRLRFAPCTRSKSQSFSDSTGCARPTATCRPQCRRAASTCCDACSRPRPHTALLSTRPYSPRFFGRRTMAPRLWPRLRHCCAKPLSRRSPSTAVSPRTVQSR